MFFFYLIIAIVLAWVAYQAFKYKKARWVWTIGAFLVALFLLPKVFTEFGVDEYLTTVFTPIPDETVS